MAKSTLGLSDIIDKIKNEFIQMEKKSTKKPKFEFDFKTIEVEISFLVSKKGKAGLNLVVAQLGGEYEKEQVHKVKFQIKPHELVYDEPENSDSGKKEYDKWKVRNEYNKPRRKTYSVKKRKRISVRRRAAARRRR